MTILGIELEVFEDDTAPAPRESFDYKRGFEAGVASCNDTNEANLAAAVADISSTLSDMTFGYAEVRVQLLERIRPLLCQVADAILPEIAKESFAAHLVETLTSHIEETAMLPVQIAVNPEAVDYLTSALSSHAGDFTFVANERLTDGQAILQNSDSHVMIDLSALTLALQTALNGLEPPERNTSNG